MEETCNIWMPKSALKRFWRNTKWNQRKWWINLRLLSNIEKYLQQFLYFSVWRVGFNASGWYFDSYQIILLKVENIVRWRDFCFFLLFRPRTDCQNWKKRTKNWKMLVYGSTKATYLISFKKIRNVTNHRFL